MADCIAHYTLTALRLYLSLHIDMRTLRSVHSGRAADLLAIVNVKIVGIRLMVAGRNINCHNATKRRTIT